MELDEYQTVAASADQVPLSAGEELKSIMVPLLGLAGESGSLLAEYKKRLRDGESYIVFKEQVREELGDLLWYIANLATKADLSLDEIAQFNIRKIRDRWMPLSSTKLESFDAECPVTERFPRKFEIRVAEQSGGDDAAKVTLAYNGNAFGDALTDNVYIDDGYRFHDVFHLAYVAVLGWSPVMRGKSFFNCKRRSDKKKDRNEDGGRAGVIDEAITALAFVEAEKYGFFENGGSVSSTLLRTIRDVTGPFDVSSCSAADWEAAILLGFKVWRDLKKAKRGVIVGDLDKKTLEFVSS